jgi:hypothetical protein
MQQLDEKHEHERHILVKLLSKEPSKDSRKQLAASNELERQEIRDNLRRKWENTQHGNYPKKSNSKSVRDQKKKSLKIAYKRKFNLN